MKTPLTIQMEESLYYSCRENGDIVIEEVTMPDDQGIVDTLSCRLDVANQFVQKQSYRLSVIIIILCYLKNCI
jgi:hypothetical protein